MQNCTWEKYRTSKTNYNVGGSLDGGTRTIYVAIEDSAGNIVTRSATYTVYKECSKTTKSYTESNYGTCSKTCGGGLQYRAYAMKDNYTSKTCSIGSDSKSCNTQSCDKTPPIFQVTKAINWVYSDTISVKITDTESGIAGYAWTSSDNEPTAWNSVSNQITSYTLSKTLISNQTIYLWAKDNAGNIDRVKIVESLIDRTPPTINYTYPDKFKNTAVTIQMSASDKESGVKEIYYKLPGEDYVKYTGPFQTTAGWLTVYAVDNANNQSKAKYYTTKCDTAAPFTPELDVEGTMAESTNRSVNCSRNEPYSEEQNECVIYAKSNRVFMWFYGDDNFLTDSDCSEVAYYEREIWVNGKLRATDRIEAGESFPSRHYSADYYYQLIYSIDQAGNRSKNALKLNLYFD